jgi:hypothetical protein
MNRRNYFLQSVLIFSTQLFSSSVCKAMQTQQNRSNEASITMSSQTKSATPRSLTRHSIVPHTRYPKNTPLRDDFKPGPFDVICGRGKSIFAHEGNHHFRNCIAQNAQLYSQARSKLDKGLIVIGVVDEIRRKSTNGGFVRSIKDKNKLGHPKQWVEIGDDLARDKVGHALRSCVHATQYTPKSCPLVASGTAYRWPSKSSEVAARVLRKNKKDELRRSNNQYDDEEESAEFSSLLAFINNCLAEEADEQHGIMGGSTLPADASHPLTIDFQGNEDSSSCFLAEPQLITSLFLMDDILRDTS